MSSCAVLCGVQSGRGVDRQAMAEYRHRAVPEVLSGSPVGEVALPYGALRQSVHTWRRRFEEEGLPGLGDHGIHAARR